MELKGKKEILNEIKEELIEKLAYYKDQTNHIINPNIDEEFLEFLYEKRAFLELLRNL